MASSKKTVVPARVTDDMKVVVIKRVTVDELPYSGMKLKKASMIMKSSGKTVGDIKKLHVGALYVTSHSFREMAEDGFIAIKKAA